MARVSVSRLRRDLPAFVQRAMSGEELEVTRRGKVVVRLSPALDARAEARRRLAQMRRKTRVGDVESPISATWEADDAAS